MIRLMLDKHPFKSRKGACYEPLRYDACFFRPKCCFFRSLVAIRFVPASLLDGTKGSSGW
jgi:hypothetical protein